MPWFQSVFICNTILEYLTEYSDGKWGVDIESNTKYLCYKNMISNIILNRLCCG